MSVRTNSCTPMFPGQHVFHTCVFTSLAFHTCFCHDSLFSTQCHVFHTVCHTVYHTRVHSMFIFFIRCFTTLDSHCLHTIGQVGTVTRQQCHDVGHDTAQKCHKLLSVLVLSSILYCLVPATTSRYRRITFFRVAMRICTRNHARYQMM